MSVHAVNSKALKAVVFTIFKRAYSLVSVDSLYPVASFHSETSRAKADLLRRRNTGVTFLSVQRTNHRVTPQLSARLL